MNIKTIKKRDSSGLVPPGKRSKKL